MSARNQDGSLFEPGYAICAMKQGRTLQEIILAKLKNKKFYQKSLKKVKKYTIVGNLQASYRFSKYYGAKHWRQPVLTGQGVVVAEDDLGFCLTLHFLATCFQKDYTQRIVYSKKTSGSSASIATTIGLQNPETSQNLLKKIKSTNV